MKCASALSILNLHELDMTEWIGISYLPSLDFIWFSLIVVRTARGRSMHEKSRLECGVHVYRMHTANERNGVLQSKITRRRLGLGKDFRRSGER